MNTGPKLIDAIAALRLKLNALKAGDGLPETHRADPGLIRGHCRYIEAYLNRADEEIQNIKTGRDMDFVKVLIDAAEYRLVIAFHLPRIISDETRIRGLRKPRWPECDDWMDRQLSRAPDLKSPEAWRRAPEWITDRIEYDRFAKRMTKARKKRAQ